MSLRGVALQCCSESSSRNVCQKCCSHDMVLLKNVSLRSVVRCAQVCHCSEAAPLIATPACSCASVALEDLRASWVVLLFCASLQCNHLFLQPGLTAAFVAAMWRLGCLSGCCGAFGLLPLASHSFPCWAATHQPVDMIWDACKLKAVMLMRAANTNIRMLPCQNFDCAQMAIAAKDQLVTCPGCLAACTLA